MLVVLLHGYGGSGEDMERYIPLVQNLPNVRCLPLDGPEVCELFPSKRQWFKISSLPDYLYIQISEQAASVVSIASHARSTENEAICFIGHSQGAMITTYIGLTNAIPNSSFISVSAALPFIEYINIGSCRNISFIHGQLDEMVPLSTIVEQLEYINNFEVDYQFLEVPFAGHKFDAVLGQRTFEHFTSHYL
ncbi:MAG: hypothetical protein GY814_07140 [Gammaproteobacteria bacterium]|nr:hypothetical protein [Gammaproteobacteria bacterium]